MPKLPLWVEHGFSHAMDFYFDRKPQPKPTKDQLEQCAIVAHRGDHDNISVLENSLEAFDAVLNTGVYGIELDIRWSKDLHPMVFHDPSMLRLFQNDTLLQSLSLKELQEQFPQIPTLQEVVKRYGQKLHLFIEVKSEDYPDEAHQNQVLAETLDGLTPGKDFHLMSLDPDMLSKISAFSKKAMLPITVIDISLCSQLAVDDGYGGIGGHYVFMNDRLLQKHHELDQKIITAYIGSPNCLFREVNRGVDWMVSNHALPLQGYVNQLINE